MIGLPDPRWIEAVTAVVVVKAGHAGARRGAGALPRAHGALQGAEAVVFVDSLPKNPSGKLLKRELRPRFADLLKEA